MYYSASFKNVPVSNNGKNDQIKKKKTYVFF